MIKRTRDILRNEQGVSIVFATLLVVVLLILGGIIVSYGYANYHRAIEDAANERNYQNVASATKLVHDEMNGQTTSGNTWASNLINGAEATTNTKELTVSTSAGDASFAAVTVRVTKDAGSSFDVACYETANPNGTAMHFTAGVSSTGMISAGKIAKVGE